MKTFLKNSVQLAVWVAMLVVIATVGFLAGQDITRQKMKIEQQEFSQQRDIERGNTVFRLKAEMTAHMEGVFSQLDELE